MHHSSCIVRLLLLLLSVFLCPVSTFAAPIEVTLYPANALVTEKTRVAVSSAPLAAVFTLPAQADPESLVLLSTGHGRLRLDDVSWRKISRENPPELDALKKRLNSLNEDKARLLATAKSLDAQIAFWQAQAKARMKTVADAGNMSSAVGKNVRKAVVDKLAAERDLEELGKRIAVVQEEMANMTGKQESAWEVTALLSGTTVRETTLTYRYLLGGCGWAPLYRLEAEPLKQRIAFSWEAEIWQSSASDWRQVAMRLSSYQPKPATAPGDLPEWVIQPKKRYYRESAKAARTAMMLEKADMAMAAPAPPEKAPRYTTEGTLSVWEAGTRSLAAGKRQKIKLSEETWEAAFVHLSRPSISDTVFLQADLRFAEPKDIPPGTATLILDGALVGKRTFTLSGREGSVFFGADPFVTVKTISLARKSGEAGLFAKTTHAWSWQIDLESQRKHPITVRVEEPLPQAGDERIQLTLTNAPEPTEKKASTQIWVVALPALGKSRIHTAVTLEAPKDLPLDLGWR